MKKNITLFLFAVILLSQVTRSQIIPTHFGSGEYHIIISSDSSSRSVLVSDLFADRSGYLSPVIGTGAWTDMGKNIQASSLLYFNINQYIVDLKHSAIIKAELILVPLMADGEKKNTTRIVLKRVIESWDDSSTTWSHQPRVSSIDGMSISLGPLKKNNYYKLNVTRLVKNMIRYGNHGFQISYPEMNDSLGSFSRWFASPRNEEPSLRPLLIITLYDPDLDIYTPGLVRTLPPTFNEAINSMPRDFRNNQIVQYLPANPTPPLPVPATEPPAPPKKDQ